MKKQHIIFTLLGLATVPAITAQTLTEEVVIDREITPEVRNVNRPTWVTPTLLTPRVEFKALSFNEYVGVAGINRSVMPLEAVAWGDSVMRSPYRGYASLGYFPVFNLGAAAGYRFVQNDKYNAGAHFSYEGSSWNGRKTAESKYKRNKLAIGLDGSVRFDAGTLAADFNYAYSSTTMAFEPGFYDRGTQALNNVGLDLKWTPSYVGRIGWDAAAYLGYGGFTSNKTDALVLLNTHTTTPFDFNPVKDLTFGAKSDLSYNFSSSSSIALGIGVDFRHINNFNIYAPEKFYSSELGEDYATIVPKTFDSQTMGIVVLRPGYKFVTGNISGRLGVQLDVNFGGFQKDTHIAPDIEVQWSPSSVIAAYLRAKGGEVMNTNAELWQRNPWMTGVFAFERSHVNADLQIGVTYGSYKGFWATLHGGWSSVSDWLCPVVAEGIDTWATPSQFNGFNFGLEIGYSWKNLFTIVGHANGAQHRKYYRWQDNAKWAFDIVAKVRPIEKLQIELGYDCRLDREGYYIKATPAPNGAYCKTRFINLGDTSNLFLGAEYEITPAFSAFLKGENLLNHHWNITDYIRSQGIHGLLGVQLKF